MKEKQDKIVSVIEKSLFESGQVLSKAITALIIISSTLLIITFYINNELVKIPLLNLELTKETAIFVLLVFFSVVNFRYTVVINHQKYLFWELTDRGGYRCKKSHPWESLYPSVYNAIFYHAYKNNVINKNKIRLIRNLSIFINAIPFGVILYYFSFIFELKGSHWVLWLLVPMSYVTKQTFDNIREYMKLHIERERNLNGIQ